MKLFLLITLPLTIITTCLFGIEPPTDIREHFPKDSVADDDGISSTFVGNHVNTASGNFTDHATDLFIDGPTPLTLARSYSNGDTSQRFLGASWDITYPLQAYTESNTSDRKRRIFDIHIQEFSGGISKYQGHAHRTSKTPIQMEYKRPYGFTNCGMGKPSGKNNPCNNKVIYHEDNLWMEVNDGGGNKRKYGKLEEHTRGYYNLYKLEKADNTLLTFINSEKALKQIFRSINGKSNAKIEFSKYKNFQLSATGSNDQKVTYNFHDLPIGKGEKSYSVNYLTSVETSHGNNTYYKYVKNENTLLWNIAEKRVGPNEDSSDYLQVEYYKQGDNHTLEGYNAVTKENSYYTNKVKKLKGPYGTLYDFYYDGPKVDVIDGENQRKQFVFSNSSVQKIIHYEGKGIHISSYIEDYTWKDGMLISKRDVEPSGHILRSLEYTYDERGNVIHEILDGYLDGSYTPSTYTKVCTYSDDGFNNLLTKEDSEGPTIIQHYVYGTDLPSYKLVVCDGKITLREFRFYDKNNLCWAETYDNGAGVEHDDFNNVTERLKVIRQYSEQPNCFGKPQAETFFYWDKNTGQDTSLKTVRYAYDALGQLTHTHIHDAEGKFCYTLEKHYNKKGKLIWENDPLGYITEYEYDTYGNNDVISGHDKRFYTQIVFDEINRPVSTRIKVPQGTVGSTSIRYDCLNHPTSKTDIFGQRIECRYDSEGRLIEQYSPAFINDKGVCTLTTERTKYNILGCPVTLEIENGETIHQRFTSRNTIAEKIYPDGSTEQWRYTDAGRLKNYTGRDGISIHYTYDRLGNKLTEDTVGPDGQTLTTMTFEWKGKRLLKITDTLGLVTSYDYDGAGRCIEECKETKRITYSYDSLGRIAEEVTWEKNSTTPMCRLQSTYDFLDRVVEKRTLDGEGTLLAQEGTTFDMCGREIINTHWTSESEFHATYTTYDILGRAVCIEDACGKKTYIDFFTIQDPHNEGLLLVRVTTDPLGRKITEVHDPYGRISKMDIRNSLGTILTARSYAYDYAGRRTECIEGVFIAGEQTSSQIFRWKYDNTGNLLQEIRGCGTPDQHIISHTYAPGNLRTSTVKPDGNIIYREYDSLSRLSHLYDTQYTISYRYTYDVLDRITDIHDDIHNIHQKKTYSNDNTLKEETLYDDVALQYTFDPLSQLRKLVYPDKTSTEYQYTGTYLQKVFRKNLQNETSYEHSIDKRTFQKGPTNVTLAGKAGTIKYAYDPQGRITSVHSDHFSQSIVERDNEYKPLCMSHTDAGDSWNENYAYTDLGFLNSEKGQITAEYTYDSIGNRILYNGKAWSYNQTNQLLSTDAQNFKYDPNGNVLNDNGKTFTYDALDRLITVEEGDDLYKYIYDDTNRRLKKIHLQKTNHEPISEERYLYCHQDEIGSCDQNGKIQQLRILADGLGGELGATIAIELEGKTLAAINDQRGSIRTLIDISTGEQEALYRYDAFGRVTHSSGSLAQNNPWKFSGKRYDPETGYTYFGSRYYDHSLGRWTTLDPVGFEGGSNGYTYVNNRPYCLIDIYGKFCLEAMPSLFGSFDDFYTGSMFKNEKDFWTYNDNVSVDEFRPMFEPSRTIIQAGNYYPEKGIGFVNGINNTSDDCRNSMHYIQSVSCGERVYGAYNATYGWGGDGYSVYLAKFNLAPQHIKTVHNTLDAYFDNAPEDGQFLLFCHSRGALITSKALKTYDKERCMRTHVVAIAPADFLDKNICGSVMHYVTYDIVPRLSSINRSFAEAQGTVEYLPSLEPSIWGDHSFQSKTYREKIIQECKYRIQRK